MDDNGLGSSRDYIVLRNNSTGYAVLGTYAATSATQAARRAAESVDASDIENGVKLVAIPERNWTEQTFRLTHQTRIVTS